MIKKNFEELKKNRLLFFLFILVLSLSQFSLQYKETLWPKFYMVLALLIVSILLSICRINDESKISWNALILISLLGTLNAFILPIRQNLDENTHFYNALQIADGKIQNQTSEVNFLSVSPDFLAVTKLPNKLEYGSETNTNLYSENFLQLKHISSSYDKKLLDTSGLNNPAYIPSALGIITGRLISNKVAVSYYLGRIFNVLFYAFLVWLAIEISRKYKLQIFVIATIPYTLWISAGFTYDNLYYGLTLLMLAQLVNFISEKQITLKKMVLYCLTCFGLVFCKAPVILVAVLPIFLPIEYFEKKKDKMLSILIILATFLLAFLWLGNKIIVSLINPVASHVQSGGAAINHISLLSRVTYFIKNPIYTIEMFLRSFSDVIQSITDTIQAAQPWLMPKSLSVINLIVFLFLILLVSTILKIKLDKKVIIGIFLIFFIITVGIIFAITGDSRVFKLGDLHVNGVQGRYHYYMLGFLPLLLSTFLSKHSLLKSESIVVFDEVKIIKLIFKLVYIISFMNTSVALYGYL